MRWEKSVEIFLSFYEIEGNWLIIEQFLLFDDIFKKNLKIKKIENFKKFNKIKNYFKKILTSKTSKNSQFTKFSHS